MEEIEIKVWYIGNWDNIDYVIDIVNGVVIYISYSSNHRVFSLQSDGILTFKKYHSSDEGWITESDDSLDILKDFGIK